MPSELKGMMAELLVNERKGGWEILGEEGMAH